MGVLSGFWVFSVYLLSSSNRHRLWGGADILLGGSLWKVQLQVSQRLRRLGVSHSGKSSLHLGQPDRCAAPTGIIKGVWGCNRNQVRGSAFVWLEVPTWNPFFLCQKMLSSSWDVLPIKFIGRCQFTKTPQFWGGVWRCSGVWVARRKQGRYLSNIYLHLTSALWSIVSGCIDWLIGQLMRGVQTCMSVPYGSKPLLTTLTQG